MRKKHLLFLSIILLIVIFVSFSIIKKPSPKTPPQFNTFSSREECEQKTNKICVFSQCETNCGPSGGFKGWVPGSRSYKPTPEVWNKQDCVELESEIDTLLSEAGQCKVDSDCNPNPIQLGCPFGCYNLVNNSADTNSLGQVSREYIDNCGKCVQKCSSKPKSEEIKCIDNKCVNIGDS